VTVDPLPSGQLSAPVPPPGGVGEACGSVVGGVEDEGEPPPQERARAATNPTAAVADRENQSRLNI
jgi:hypothetical protein